MHPRPGVARAVAIITLATMATASLPARAAPPSPPAASPTPDATTQAAELRRRGNDAMAAFRPGEAAEDYRQAYELTHDPALLYNMGRALEALEDYPAALVRYEDFARLATPELRARVPKLDETLQALRGRVARVSVVCNVPGARVLLRQKAVGETLAHADPLVLTVVAGEAALEVDADGYNPYTRTLALPGGGNVSVDVEMVPKALAGLLVVASQPAGGVVFVDGRELGSAPVETSVAAGNHQVAVRLQGFVDKSTSVVVALGERRAVTLDLRESPPITKQWWFWTGLGAIVATGVGISIAALTERSAGSGSIAPGRTTAP
jgi:hypothetical protein